MSYKKYLDSLGKKKVVKKYANGGDTEDPIKPARDWLSNWFKNRKTTDEEVNKFLTENRDEIIKRINNVPAKPYPTIIGGDGNVYMDKGEFVDINGDNKDDIPVKGLLGEYDKQNKEINYLRSLGGDSSTIKHELTHAGMDNLYNDYTNNLISGNLSKISNNSTDTKEMLYDKANRSLVSLLQKAKNEDIGARANYIEWLKSKNYSPDEFNKELNQYDSQIFSDSMSRVMESNPTEYANTMLLARNPLQWQYHLQQMPSKNISTQVELRDTRPIKTKNEFVNSSTLNKQQLDYYNKYVSQPDEVHARIMEIRNALGVQPDQVIDKGFLDKNREKLNDTDAYLQLKDLLKEGDNSLIDLMNRLAQSDKKSNRFSQYLNTIKNA